MAKLTLSDVTNSQNETSYNSTINNNSALIETALENTLSRDGTVPNYMTADLDMNSNRILNLPNAVTDQEPITYNQLSELVLASNLEIVNVRERLTATRTYYVRTDGNNNNTGLIDSAGGAFLTIQKALDVILGTLDLGGFNVDVQVRDGTYTGRTNFLSPQVGAGVITIKGNATTPANVLISTVPGAGLPIYYEAAFKIQGNGSFLVIKDMKIQTATNGGCVLTLDGGVAHISNINFGPSARMHIEACNGGQIKIIGDYTVSGGAFYHGFGVYSGLILTDLVPHTATVTGTPNFTGAFMGTAGVSVMDSFGLTISGTATGKRYDVNGNSYIQSYGRGINYFPGSIAGTTSTGGQYV